MLATSHRLRPNQPAPRLPLSRALSRINITTRPRTRDLPAFVPLFSSLYGQPAQQLTARCLSGIRSKTWTPKKLASEAPGRGGYRGLGQGKVRHIETSTEATHQSEQFSDNIKSTLQKGVADILPDDLVSWRRLFTLLRNKHGKTGVWACFELLRERHDLHVVLQEEANNLRVEIIEAAAEKTARLETLLHVAIRLPAFSQEWPDFYPNVVCSLLEMKDYQNALAWHLRLSRHFPPGPEVLGGLLSKFAIDQTPELQSTLTSMYVFSAERSLYDRIIPALFDTGASQIARVWRKKLIKMEDYPTSARSGPFITFLAQYYPTIQLLPEEVALVGQGRHSSDTSATKDIKVHSQNLPRKGIYRDDIIAKWFASSWLSIEFATNFLHRMGLQVIGPRSLQALALREGDPHKVAARIAQLERLGIGISPTTYCKALVLFAQKDEGKLLDRLLHTDIHPDEFDSINTRKMIMADAATQKNWDQEELFQGVEWAVENHENPHRLNQLLRHILVTRKLGKARIIVDRMEALKISMTQENANKLLQRVYHRVGKHPSTYYRWKQSDAPNLPLDRAINVTRRIASQNLAVSSEMWHALLYSLGRTGRLEEFLQLSLEMIGHFRPRHGGLMPVFSKDAPPIKILAKSVESDTDLFDDIIQQQIRTDTPRELREGQVQEEKVPASMDYIPADLPFSHRQHPIQKLFDSALQRRIVRWGFDQSLQRAPPHLPMANSPPFMLVDFDIACGVRLLAVLRDHGVLIDPQVIRTAIADRTAVGQMPMRRHRLRGSHDVSPENVKRLVDQAWGSEVLPSLPKLAEQVEKHRLGTFKKYSGLHEAEQMRKARL